MKDKFLVCGGAGFIGVNFVKMLCLSEHYDILVLDALTYAGNLASLEEEIADGKIQFVKADIGDEKAVSEIIDTFQPDYIINFAAETHVDRSVDNPRPFVMSNVLGTQNLLECARRKARNLKKFVQIGTDEVYGDLEIDYAESVDMGDALATLLGRRAYAYGRVSFSESSPIKPSSPYSASKASADMMALAYHRTYGLPVVVTRCSNNYGPYQFPEKLIPLMINNIEEGRALPVYGKGLNVRDWIYVDDHCEGVLAAARHGRSGQVYNFGGYCEKTNIEVVRLLIETLGKGEIEFVTDRPGHDRRYAIDASKSMAELGWRPRVAFAEGLSRTIKWYLDNRQWVKNIVDGDYRDYYNKMYSNR